MFALLSVIILTPSLTFFDIFFFSPLELRGFINLGADVVLERCWIGFINLVAAVVLERFH